ncbi:MAG: thioredoxin domain-containing protein, partial [Chloroflexota bacterium]
VRTWREERGEITRVGGQVTQHLQAALSAASNTLALTSEHLGAIANKLVESYDWGYGGWGSAPKFPQPMTIDFLLARAAQHRTTENTESTESQKGSVNSVVSVVNPKELDAALHALKAMARGGMYDVVGGGFARYSTDNFWRVPHFEKMLYDNAQLARAYLHAWQITGDAFYRRVAEETLDFVAREMTHPDGGFYSSLDADSEGEEGKFYVWTADELRAALDSAYDFFAAAYGVTERGNWEGRTVLQRALDDSTLAARFKIDVEAVPVELAECHSRLLAARGGRVRPATDDKVLTAWNGLMLGTFAEAARVLTSDNAGEEIASVASLSRNDTYYKLATRNVEFLLTALRPNGQLRRSWRDGKATVEVFLEDHAALILGLLELYQTDFDNKRFASALELADEMIARFRDPAGGFFDTPSDGETLLLRPKDLQDNATPSGNALACEALLKLAAFTDNGEYRDLAEKSLTLIGEYALKYPLAFARWLSAAEFALGPVKQVAVVAEAGLESARELVDAVRAGFRPNVVIAASSYPPGKDAPPLLRDRPLVNGRSAAYVCEGFVCKQPVTSAEELRALLG